jgi:hypothetical protein
MQLPTWTKPAVTGGIAGAILTMIVGFNQGGWVLGSTAEKRPAGRPRRQPMRPTATSRPLAPECFPRLRPPTERNARRSIRADSLVAGRRGFVRREAPPRWRHRL